MKGGIDLTGKAVFISGGAGALGVAITAGLNDLGATVIVNDILDPGSARKHLPESENVHYLQGDATDAREVAGMLDACLDLIGKLPDTVCCHAGIVESHPVQLFPLRSFDDAMRVNVRSAFVLAREASSRWIDEGRGGQLLFTTSWVHDTPWPGIGPYSATKAAVLALTRSFARELAPSGIRANAISPGIVAAGMAQRQWDNEPDYRARAERAIPLGFLQPAESVANAFVFMVSELSTYMTGSELVVDGGCSLYPMD